MCGVPDDVCKRCLVDLPHVVARYLQVVSVQVALVQSDDSIGSHFLLEAPPHVVIRAFDDGVLGGVFESHGAILRVVGDAPDCHGVAPLGRRRSACGGLDERLIARGIVFRDEVAAVGGYLRVLVELIGGVSNLLCIFLRGDAVAYVVVIQIAVTIIADATCSADMRHTRPMFLALLVKIGHKLLSVNVE